MHRTTLYWGICKGDLSGKRIYLVRTSIGFFNWDTIIFSCDMLGVIAGVTGLVSLYTGNIHPSLPWACLYREYMSQLALGPFHFVLSAKSSRGLNDSLCSSRYILWLQSTDRLVQILHPWSKFFHKIGFAMARMKWIQWIRRHETQAWPFPNTNVVLLWLSYLQLMDHGEIVICKREKLDWLLWIFTFIPKSQYTHHRKIMESKLFSEGHWWRGERWRQDVIMRPIT